MTVKRGSVYVRIYRRRCARGYITYTAAYYEADGFFTRKTFANLEDAKTHALDAAERLSRGGDPALVLQGHEQLVYARACETLQPLGVPLDTVVLDYAHAMQLLKGRESLLGAVRWYVKNHAEEVVSCAVQKAVNELIITREKDGSSIRHTKDLRSRLDRFARSFQCDIASVTAADIQDFLLSLKLAPKSVNNFRTAISNLFSFARLKRYVAKDHKPVAEVPEFKEPEKEIGIYTPAELQLLIEHAAPKFLPYVLIAAFAGLRQSEIGRLDWCHVGTDYIRVPGGERRTKSKRLVEIQPNLKQWLAPLRQSAGPIAPYCNLSNEITDLYRKAGVIGKHNGLRHSYGSYRVATLKDPAKVAHEMGNSPRIVSKHYMELVTPEQATAWFAIAPITPTNLVPFGPVQAVQTPVAPASDVN